VTIKLSGQKIKAACTPSDSQPILSTIIVGKGGALTLTGSGTVKAAGTEATDPKPSLYAIYVKEEGALKVKDNVAVTGGDSVSALIALERKTSLSLTTEKDLKGGSAGVKAMNTASEYTVSINMDGSIISAVGVVLTDTPSVSIAKAFISVPDEKADDADSQAIASSLALKDLAADGAAVFVGSKDTLATDEQLAATPTSDMKTLIFDAAPEPEPEPEPEPTPAPTQPLNVAEQPQNTSTDNNTPSQDDPNQGNSGGNNNNSDGNPGSYDSSTGDVTLGDGSVGTTSNISASGRSVLIQQGVWDAATGQYVVTLPAKVYNEDGHDMEYDLTSYTYNTAYVNVVDATALGSAINMTTIGYASEPSGHETGYGDITYKLTNGTIVRDSSATPTTTATFNLGNQQDFVDCLADSNGIYANIAYDSLIVTCHWVDTATAQEYVKSATVGLNTYDGIRFSDDGSGGYVVYGVLSGAQGAQTIGTITDTGFTPN
jgi:hypothetical protein